MALVDWPTGDECDNEIPVSDTTTDIPLSLSVKYRNNRYKQSKENYRY